MRALRARLLWLAVLTLTVQIAGLAMAPAALCCLPGAEQQVTMNCCKDAGPGHICPLMKKKSGQSNPTGASLRSCCNIEDQIFTALFGFLGVPVPSTASLAAPPIAFSFIGATSHPFEWLAPADSPPPRA